MIKMNYEIGSNIVYNKWGKLRNGSIKSIDETRTIPGNTIKRKFTVIPNIKDNLGTYDYVDENEIVSWTISDEQADLFNKAEKLALKHYNLAKSIESDLDSIYKHPTNNDWRITSLREKIQKLTGEK